MKKETVQAVIREQQEGGAQLDEDTPITGGWCNLNQGNILQQRTRSQSVT